ncbi:hypothetical protein ACIQI8_24125 [Streptomyces sp. NPDC092369]|uniref:hypothetical protein n=1 Tax=Streptomyces sp. NPDC092369 TaxID=3366015 RepID=UPI00382ACC2C
MSEANTSLLKTVARIEELIAESGRRLEEVLDIEQLALASGLAEAEVELLNRELRKILFDLEVEADPAKALRAMGVVHMSGRSPLMKKPDLAALARMVAELPFDVDRVRRAVDHLANHPEADQ